MGRRGNSNYSILFDAKFEAKQINEELKKIKLDPLSLDIKADTKGATDKVKDLDKAMGDAQLTFNAANEVFRTTLDIITSLAEQVYALDGSLTEFKKVSKLSGQALDDYVSKLQKMGNQVARTGSEMVDASTKEFGWVYGNIY